MYKIQNSIHPKISLCSEIELYFRLNNLVTLNFESNSISLSKFGKIITDTYFNSFSIGKWKKYTKISNLNFSIKFRGMIKIVWYVNQIHFSRRFLKEIVLESSSISEKVIDLDFWPMLSDGMLAFEIIGLSDGEIYNFSYQTQDEIINNIKLGIVITHFNRQEYVVPALHRLKEELLELDDFRENVSLYVIDNSQNLGVLDNITIIPNENLGGSGGFSRGLLELKESGEFSHCLFMDDDASCEVEGIKRTIRLLEYAKDSELAIGGAMLREDEMYRQYENGAKFDGLLRPIKPGLDLREVPHLLINELEENIDFCGWWYFAFPLSKVKHYAFPFFVRGDDIGFGLAHKFKIITLNGISSWQGDFALKHGPLPAYLDNRHQIMQHFHHFSDKGLFNLITTTARMTMRNLLTYHYDTALASIMALEDAMKGDDFWENNVDMSSKRKEISSIIEAEKVTSIPSSLLNLAHIGNPYESKFARYFRWLTLNGNLLPTLFFKNGIVLQNKAQGHLREVYRYKRVLYVHKPTNTGFVLEHNKMKFFKLFFRYIKAILELSKRYEKLKIEYKNSYTKLTSESFWKKQFKSEK